MQGKYILMVEDNEDDIKLILRTLSENHVTNKVELARDGEEAINMLFGKGADEKGAFIDNIALVLLDIKLPKINGLEVLKRIRENQRTKNLPVVMLTSSNQERDIVDSYNGGCNSYVCKPVEYLEFCKAVEDIGLYWLFFNQTVPR